MPNSAELAERYLQFMEDYNETLPAGTSDEERERLTHLALDQQIERDLESITQAAETDLKAIEEQAEIEEGHATAQEDAAKKLEEVRQSLG